MKEIYIYIVYCGYQTVYQTQSVIRTKLKVRTNDIGNVMIR